MVCTHAIHATAYRKSNVSKLLQQDPNALGSPFRIAQEGLPLLLPHLSKQLLRPTAAELLRMLKERSVVMPRTQQLPEPEVKRLIPC